MSRLMGRSPAKVNLTLRVLGRRPDGFHEIESLVARVNLCDTVTVSGHEDGCYALECDDPALPRDGSNLVLQAARALNRLAGTNYGAELTLTKRIPAGSGLGGGSSNAATTLRLLNELWNLRLSARELTRVGAELGADVPLFFHSPVSVIRGRGEQVEDLPPWPPYWLVLVVPQLRCATPAIYAAWDGLDRHPARPQLSRVLEAPASAAELMELLFNDLEAAAFAVVPELGRLAQRITQATGFAVRMTGSGSALFRLFDDAPAASRFALQVGMECGVRADVVGLGAD